MDYFRRFMIGRYGNDDLNRFLLMVAMGTGLLYFGTRIRVLGWLTLALIVLLYGRMLSRNTTARYRENQFFHQKTVDVKKWHQNVLKRWDDRKTHRYYKCPNCKMRLRVPKGRGKISITCPSCRTQFVKKT